MATVIKTKLSGQIIFSFDTLDAVERLYDVINDGLSASPRNQLFADDIIDLRDELHALLKKEGE